MSRGRYRGQTGTQGAQRGRVPTQHYDKRIFVHMRDGTSGARRNWGIETEGQHHEGTHSPVHRQRIRTEHSSKAAENRRRQQRGLIANRPGQKRRRTEQPEPSEDRMAAVQMAAAVVPRHWIPQQWIVGHDSKGRAMATQVSAVNQARTRASRRIPRCSSGYGNCRETRRRSQAGQGTEGDQQNADDADETRQRRGIAGVYARRMPRKPENGWLRTAARDSRTSSVAEKEL